MLILLILNKTQYFRGYILLILNSTQYFGGVDSFNTKGDALFFGYLYCLS